jgi:translation initiation factor IF-2
VVITGSAATGRFIDLTPPAARQAPARSVDRPVARLEARPAAGAPRSRYGHRGAARSPLGRRRPMTDGGARAAAVMPAAEHKRVVRMGETIPVAELAQRLSVKSTEVVKKLWTLGLMGVTVNQSLDFDTASLVAAELGHRVESNAFREEELLSSPSPEGPVDLAPRAPVVTVMGHVDHGKTSLLDAIRQANVAAGEAGGITQHIGAYRVQTARGEVVFLDTPGHEAFTAMRARGARMTDIVVLVVAADDGPMPQTLEAIDHARAAKVPIVVAVNKVDLPGAQPERVRHRLMERGLVPEELGGDTIFVDVSARTKVGIERLLETLALHAEVLELRANPSGQARGHVVEARLDRNRGPVVTVLVTQGTLRAGDVLVAGEASGKVRAMAGDRGQKLVEAAPSTPLEVMGLDAVPEAGDQFHVVSDERAARTLVEHRREQRRGKQQGRARVSLESVFDRLGAGEVRELRLVLKADVQGSAEALAGALRALSTPAVKVEVIATGVGAITESDVALAKASTAIVLGFNVRPAGKAQRLAEQDGVDVRLYRVIYEALDDVRRAMTGLLEPVRREQLLGQAEVRQLFSVPRSVARTGTVAGCTVIDGKLSRRAPVRVVRDGAVVHTGRLASLRRFKDDVPEVGQGYECGLSLEAFADLKVGDTIESFEVETVAATLDPPPSPRPRARVSEPTQADASA